MSFEIKGLKPVNDWIKLIRDTSSTFHKKLHSIYDDNDDLKLEAAKMCLRTLEAFTERFSANRRVLVIRSTGRINLLGTHIDHRGGSVNPIAVKHMWLAVEPRDDDLVLAKNVESNDFPDEQFGISQSLPVGEKIEHWDTWCHDEFEKRRHDRSISWSNYIRAAVLYFQHINTNDNGSFQPVLRGMNMMVYGNVPRAAGLSSSSALVTLTAEALVRINGIQIDRIKLAEFCGHAEWYVGTRGGFSDHAAITFGEPNSLLHITAFPMTIDIAALAAGYKFVLANSLIEAKKQAGARDAFNSRVAAYAFGLMMIRKNFPQYADKLRHLRDVNPETLGVGQAEIYRIVQSLPASAGREDILKYLPECEQEIHHAFRSHAEPSEGYPIRQVCLYGITECIRADMAPKCLRAGDMKKFGELINISHNGDRVTKLIEGRRVLTDNTYPDERVDTLVAHLQSDDAARMSRAELWRQGGGYNVSHPEIDTLVDIALATDGVIGAGLVGAGMGGCIVAVVKDENAQRLIENMAEQYYSPRNLPVKAEIITPVGGLCSMD